MQSSIAWQYLCHFCSQSAATTLPFVSSPIGISTVKQAAGREPHWLPPLRASNARSWGTLSRYERLPRELFRRERSSGGPARVAAGSCPRGARSSRRSAASARHSGADADGRESPRPVAPATTRRASVPSVTKEFQCNGKRDSSLV